MQFSGNGLNWADGMGTRRKTGENEIAKVNRKDLGIEMKV